MVKPETFGHLHLVYHFTVPLNGEKCQTLTMLQLNVVHQDTRKILIFNNLYIIQDSFEKKRWQDMLNFTTTRDQLIDWHFRMTRLCYSQRSEDV